MAAPKLDFNKIKNLYKEGEFDKIRVDLERFLKQAGESAEPKEKIFTFKYLGVVYAAEAQGYPVAETYFYRLFWLAPNAYLSDLYVSSAVENLFEKTKTRFLKETRDLKDFDEFGNPRTSPSDQAHGKGAKDSAEVTSLPTPLAQPLPMDPKNPQPEIKSRRKVWPWIVAGAGVTAGIGIYLWILTQNEGTHTEIDATPH
ncbi:MAG: hypothetical protein JWP91_3111 [Fibrobacteres bacterium]|nr:hypothetical protein [Fibrobacterota bacterium]